MKKLLPLAFIALIACSGGGSGGGGAGVPPTPRPTGHHNPSPIQHVVIIIQENRSLNNLFMGFPGAMTATSGLNTNGQTVPLQPVSLTARYDLGHEHTSFKQEYDGGKMDGWNTVYVNCPHTQRCPAPGTAAYGYVPRNEIQPYWDMAQQYTLADQMYQTNQGPSFPAHQYLVSGTSTIADGSDLRSSENPQDEHTGGDQGGCDSLPAAYTTVITPAGDERRGPYPCYDRSSIFTLLDGAGVSWKYYEYATGAGLWNAVDALHPIYVLPEFKTNVVAPSAQVLTDIANGNLAQVSYVTPTDLASDHALRTDGSGPDWVASIVNAVGQSPYWNSTAIFIVDDDWGGWYDPETPTIRNSYELSFRVPLIIVSPYAKNGYISHVPHEFGSILKFTEQTFGLPSLGTTDSASDNLSDCFSFSKPARHFRAIHTKHNAQYFIKHPGRGQPPDDD